MCVTVCESVLLTVKSDEERHGHRLKGDSPLNYTGPKTSYFQLTTVADDVFMPTP